MSGMEVTEGTLLGRNGVCRPVAPAPIRPAYTSVTARARRLTLLGRVDRPPRAGGATSSECCVQHPPGRREASQGSVSPRDLDSATSCSKSNPKDYRRVASDFHRFQQESEM